MKQMIAILLAGAFLLIGCQSQNEPLEAAQKNTEQIIEIAQVGNGASDTSVAADHAAQCAAYGVPERYVAELSGEDGRLLVHADVEITVPKTASMPTARVENGRFSQEMVSRLFKALCGNTTMYLHPDGALPENADLVRSDGALLSRELPTPEGRSNAPVGTMTFLDATSAPYDDNAATFWVNNDAGYKSIGVSPFADAQGNTQVYAPQSGSSLQFHRAGAAQLMEPHNASTYYVCDVTQAALNDSMPEESILTITPRQALHTVTSFFTETGISDMAIQQIILFSTKQPPQGDHALLPDSSASQEDTESERQCYAIRCLRKVNDVSVESTEAYSEYEGIRWWYESLWINVDNEGISNLVWNAPLNVTMLESENTALIPWPQAQEVFEKMFMVAYDFLAKDADTKVEFTIRRVELCLQRINDQGAFTNGLLIPVWNFYGWYTDSTEVPTDEILFPLISINAIDGSVIDVNQGF